SRAVRPGTRPLLARPHATAVASRTELRRRCTSSKLVLKSELLVKPQRKITGLFTRNRVYFGADRTTLLARELCFRRQRADGCHLVMIGPIARRLRSSIQPIEIGRAIRGVTPALSACRRPLHRRLFGEWSAYCVTAAIARSSRIDSRPDRRRHRRLLRVQHDELAARHSITSSARASSPGCTSSPSALAVLRLITISYFVGAWQGPVSRL